MTKQTVLLALCVLVASCERAWTFVGPASILGRAKHAVSHAVRLCCAVLCCSRAHGRPDTIHGWASLFRYGVVLDCIGASVRTMIA